MRPTFGLCLDAERVERAGRALRLWLAALPLAACSTVQAEVGSDPPWTHDAASFDGASVDGSIGRDGVSGSCDTSAPLRLYLWNLRPAPSSTDVNFLFKVENATGAAVPLRSLKTRYFLTNELAPPTKIDVFYSDTCCSNKVTGFNDDVVTSLQTGIARPGADSYLEIGFTPAALSLAPGDAVQVEIAFHDVGYTRTLNQADDYSFSATSIGSQPQWDACPGPQCDSKFTSCSMTALRDDALVWGAPP